MEMILMYAVSFASGLCASMGLGGGTVLILWLTLAESLPQQQAQGINLVFFIPCALTAMFFYRRSGMIEIQQLAPALVSGTVGAVIGASLSGLIVSEVLRRAFGAFLLIMGMRSLTSCQSRLTRQMSFSCACSRDNPQE